MRIGRKKRRVDNRGVTRKKAFLRVERLEIRQLLAADLLADGTRVDVVADSDVQSPPAFDQVATPISRSEKVIRLSNLRQTIELDDFVVNGSAGNVNRSGITSLGFEFDQPTTFGSQSTLRLLNRTSSETLTLDPSLLKGNQTSDLVWDLGSMTLDQGHYTATLAIEAVVDDTGVQTRQSQGYTQDFSIRAGDTSGDGVVNFADFGLIGKNFDRNVGQAFRPGDADGNGIVNFEDFSHVFRHFDSVPLPLNQSSVQLRVFDRFTTSPPIPGFNNDDFVNRVNLGSVHQATDTGNNDGYTGEAGEIEHDGPTTSAWWSWTAPASGILTIDTVGSNYDTYLTLATGSNVAQLTSLAGNDDFGGTLLSQIVANVQPGVTYQIAVDGFSNATGDITLNLSFVSSGTMDFGDAPAATDSGFVADYPTMLADDGARHIPVIGFALGTAVDTEADGQPNLSATGDDQSSFDDEDGVNFASAIGAGLTSNVNVSVTNSAAVANPFLDAWIDFNFDGDWLDAGEQIYSGPVVAGVNTIGFSVPANASAGQTYSRFRLHDGVSSLATTGEVASGEVEDHVVSITTPGVWIDQGPLGTINGQLEFNTQPNRRITGAIHTVLAHPTDPDILYIGGVNGGIWKTTNATDVLPDWTTTTDQLGSLSIGAMEFDANDPTSQTLVAATARYSSFGGFGGDRGAIYRSTNGGDQWTELPSVGLNNRNLSGVAARGQLIVATSSTGGGGVFRSTNGGDSFIGIDSADFDSPGDNFTDLATDPSDLTGNRLYAASEGNGGSGGIYRSDNFGATWVKVTGPSINSEMDDLLDQSNVIEFSVHPVTGRIYAAVLVGGQPEGIFYSDSASSANPTWTRMDIPVIPVGTGQPVSGASNTSPIQITSAGHGLSSNEFVIVNGVGGNTAANGFFRVDVINNNTFELRDSVGNGAYTGGGTWTEVTGPSPSSKIIDEKTGAQGRIHFSIRVHPTDPDIIFVGGDRQNVGNVIGDNVFGGAIFRGDAGITRNPSALPSPQWDHATHDIVAFDPQGGTANGTSTHADSREMVFDANGDLIEVDDGGIFRRTNPLDNTGDWFSLAGSLGVIEFHDIAYDNNTNTLLGGTQDNGTHFQVSENGQQWDFLSGGDGGDVGVDTVSLAAAGRSVRYSSFQNLGAFRRTVWDSNNNLLSTSFPSLSLTAGNPITPTFKTPVQLNVNDPNRLLFIGGNGIYESSNQGTSIQQVGANHSVGFLQDAVVYGGFQNGVANPDVFYVGTRDDIRIRTSPGSSVITVDPDPTSNRDIADVTIASDDWSHVWAIDNNSVFQSLDTGNSWIDVTGNLMAIAGSQLFSLQYVPGAVGALVVGGSLGVFSALVDQPNIWAEVGSNLPNAPAFDIVYDAIDDVLAIGTLGRGSWTLPLASTLWQDKVCRSKSPPVESTSTAAVSIGRAFTRSRFLGTNRLSRTSHNRFV